MSDEQHRKEVEEMILFRPGTLIEKYVALACERDAAVEALRIYREFYEAWWKVEEGVIDFDLHADAVSRLSTAHAAIIKAERAALGVTEPKDTH